MVHLIAKSVYRLLSEDLREFVVNGLSVVSTHLQVVFAIEIEVLGMHSVGTVYHHLECV